MASSRYVHGYESRESERLFDQATTLAELLHAGTAYSAGSCVLEAGCGTGAQTVALVQSSPQARITCVDLSADSLAEARLRTEAAGIDTVRFVQADVLALPFAPASFDHVFVCFVLEHVPQPIEALRALARVLKPGGSITVIEGDHGSAYFHPRSDAADDAIACQVALQRAAGGDALIGRRLYPLLREAGFEDVHVTPRMVYVDGSRPELIEGFTKKTFTAMIEGVRDAALEAGMISAERFDAGIRALSRTAAADGVFCYTFFKAVALAGGER